MRISEQGIDLIRRYEGCRLEAYQDSAGVWTIGIGHTGEAAQPGATITLDRAEDLLRSDLDWAEQAVRELVTEDLTQSQFDALVSFTFNLGAWAFRRSTLRRRVNEGQHLDVPEELCRWIYADARPLKGLARRRVAEASLYLSD